MLISAAESVTFPAGKLPTLPPPPRLVFSPFFLSLLLSVPSLELCFYTLALTFKRFFLSACYPHYPFFSHHLTPSPINFPFPFSSYPESFFPLFSNLSPPTSSHFLSLPSPISSRLTFSLLFSSHYIVFFAPPPISTSPDALLALFSPLVSLLLFSPFINFSPLLFSPLFFSPFLSSPLPSSPPLLHKSR